MDSRRILAVVFVVLFSASCSQKRSLDSLAVKGVLSSEEAADLQNRLDTQGPGAPVTLNIVNKNSELNQIVTTVGSVEEISETLNSTDTMTVEYSLSVQDADGGSLQPNEQLLYSGKEEFGLTEWKTNHPLADGRGVIAGVVDDGVALSRPGLLTTSTGERKILRSINTSPLWHLPLHTQWPEGCAADGVGALRDNISTWALPESVGILSSAKKVIPFFTTPCGVNLEISRRPKNCVNWSGVTSLDSVFLEKENGEEIILVDVNKNKIIEEEEVLSPVSSVNFKSYRLPSGRVLAFDLIKTESLPTYDIAVDHPVRDCIANEPAPEKTLLMIPPHTRENFGTHGEGVASILAGHQIAGRAFDGVAPGAQIIDVHFSDPIGGRRYTISEIAKALKTAGQFSDVVNLSYSLFFHSAASQIAMGRFLNAYLSNTTALYFFSAGNNGPGRGSMNRGLLYPANGIVVGAYLTPSMSQTVFGSSGAIGGVVTYSSRGPGVDGASGPMVISPLAGMVSSTSEENVNTFSGTSSATPALAGFAARIISAIKADGLEKNPTLLKRAILESATALPGVAYVDQGFGLPNLERAYSIYKNYLDSLSGAFPQLLAVGQKNSYGVDSAGIYVRGMSDRQSIYEFQIKPQFTQHHSDDYRAGFSESLNFTTTASWIRVPPHILIGREGSKINIGIDWSVIDTSDSGEYLGEVIVKNDSDGKVRAVIPVTLIKPDYSSTGTQISKRITVTAGGLTRLYLHKPSWANQIIFSIRSADTRNNLCGVAKIYNPFGVKLNGKSFTDSQSTRKDITSVTTTAGVYELDFEGRGNHILCPENQEWNVEVLWVGIQSTVVNRSLDNQQTVSQIQFETESPSNTTGVVRFVNAGHLVTIPLEQTASGFEWVASSSYDVSGFHKAYFALPESFATERSRFYGYAYWSLLVETNDATRFAESESISSDGTWSPTSFSISEGTTSVKPTLSLFDLGPQMEGLLPTRQITLQMKLMKQAPYSSVSLMGTYPLSIKEYQPQHLRMLLEKNQDYPTLIVDCLFRPDGFQADVSCGSLQLK